MDHLLELDTCIIALSSESSSSTFPAGPAVRAQLRFIYQIYPVALYYTASPKSHINRLPWTNKFSLLFEERSCEDVTDLV